MLAAGQTAMTGGGQRRQDAGTGRTSSERYFAKQLGFSRMRLMLVSVPASCFPPTKLHSGAAQQGSRTKQRPSLREVFMVISNISKLKFDRLFPLHGLLETLIGKEVEWFADEASNTIGTIAGAKADKGWNFAILRRDRLGNFQMCNLRRDLYNLHTAAIDFLRSMAAAETTSRWPA
jgi:hypothetical protein